MRKITFLLAFLFVATIYAQDQDLARVQKVNGVEVYILSEPLREYEVVFGEGNKIQWTSFLTAGLLNESISDKVSKFVKGVLKEAEKENAQVDAVVYTNGKSVTAIKFTGEKTKDNNGIARVQKMEGVPVFVMSQPLLEYTVEKDKGPGIKWKSMVTAGLVNNSIEQDMAKYVDRFSRHIRKNRINAIVYERGKEALGVELEAPLTAQY